MIYHTKFLEAFFSDTVRDYFWRTVYAQLQIIVFSLLWQGKWYADPREMCTEIMEREKLLLGKYSCVLISILNICLDFTTFLNLFREGDRCVS